MVISPQFGHWNLVALVFGGMVWWQLVQIGICSGFVFDMLFPFLVFIDGGAAYIGCVCVQKL